MTEQGIIIKGIGGFYYVATPEGTVECRARGRFRRDGISPMVGDNVSIEMTDGGKGYVTEIAPRKNLFVRPPVANLDLLVIVISAAPPVTDVFMADTMAAVSIHKGIEPAVVINKSDLDPGDALFGVYSKAGMRCIRASAVTGEGREELLSILAGKLSAFSGNSGVGKSSLLNRIDPRFGIETGLLNEKLGRGRHTTRHVELFSLENGATIADTPGFSSFETTEMDLIDKVGLQYAFPEFSPFLDRCLFTGCSHVKDKGCAIRGAVEDGIISASRYESYIRMYRAALAYKEWDHR